MKKCPNCGFDLEKDETEKKRKEAEDIFTLLIEGKKKEIEQKYGKK